MIGVLGRAAIPRCRHCGIIYPRILKAALPREVEPTEPTRLELLPPAPPVAIAEGVVRFESDCGEMAEMQVKPRKGGRR
jgi:hypothetical protein